MRILIATAFVLTMATEAHCGGTLVNPPVNFDITCTGQVFGTSMNVDTAGYYIVQIWERVGNSGNNYTNVASNGAQLTAGTHTINVQLHTMGQGVVKVGKATLTHYTMPGSSVVDSNEGTLRGP